MSAIEAARISDQIGHTSALAGLLIGALAGVALAVAVVAVVGTGGMAAVAIGAGIAAAGAAGGLSGAYIGELIPTSPTGAIITGSLNTFIELLSAARAIMDTAGCSGVVLPHGMPKIAQGSSSVFINNFPAARKTDKLVCGASISKASRTVFVGGGTTTYLEIDEDVPKWLRTTLWVVMVGGTIIATGGAVLAFGWGPAIGGLGGSFLGSLGFGFVGGKIGRGVGGYFGNAELGARIGEVLGGLAGGVAGGVGGTRLGGMLGGSTSPIPPQRLPQDVAVNPTPPQPRPLNRPVGQSPTQNAQVQADIAAAQAQGATNFRVNQQQVNAAGQRVGVNRPDLQYTDANGRRVYTEYDRPGSPRGPQHQQRILSNDPNGTVILKSVP